jgi:DUF917 family protein|tara:strand:- start:358 stop:1695 length:1338 start_codon:yes stop_codon:yes gene_type:complete
MKTKQKRLLIMTLLVGISVFLYGSIGVNTDNIPYKKSIGKLIFLSDLAEFKLKTRNKTPETFLNENQPLLLENGSIVYSKEQLKYILASFNILGCGGGGSYYDALTILNAMQQENVEVIDIENTDDNKLYVVAGGMGQPSALKSQIPETIASIKIAINTLVDMKGIPLGGILNVESGPVNGILAVLMAAELGVPVVNADGGGRSVPSLTNLAYNYEEYPISPVVLKPLDKSTQKYTAEDAADAEAQIGKFMAENNVKIAGLALWAQTGAELKTSQIPQGSYSYAYEMGIYTNYTMSRGNPYYLEKFLKENNRFISSNEETLLDYTIRNVENRFDAIDITTDTKAIRAVNENLLIRNKFESDTINNALATAPNLISFLIKGEDEDSKEVYFPYNNGDVEAMEASIGKSIYMLNSKAPSRVYYDPIQESFLSVLKAQIGYKGPVKPE